MRGPVEIRGLESLQRRLADLARATDLRPALRAEAETVAADARAALESRSAKGAGALARSVEIIEMGQGEALAFAVGTRAAAGHFLEFGTTRARAAPWLLPALHGRLPGIKHAIRTVLTMAWKH